MPNAMEQEPQTIQTAPVSKAAPPSSRPARRSMRGVLLLCLIVGAAIAYGIYAGISSRAKASTELQHTTTTLSVPSVNVMTPKLDAAAQEVVIPGNIQAFIDTPIYARSSGYLKAWYADIGTHVKAGQLLAVTESPETDQQLQQAREDLSTAESNLKLAQLTADRYNDLFKSDSVARQEVDNAVQDAAARKSTVSAAQANVSRLEHLVGYEKITAPFDGVITQRNTDVGALIDSGSMTPGRELFHLSSTSKLRVYINVPEVYDRAAVSGVGAYLTLTEFPGRQFHGVIARNAKAIDPASRTLLVEVDVQNPGGELLPGSYASVHLKLPSKVQAMTVPVSALLFRAEGLQVALVRNGRTELAHVVMGRDFGETVEILSGISKDDKVIVNPSDSVVSGQQVQIASSSSGAGQ